MMHLILSICGDLQISTEHLGTNKQTQKERQGSLYIVKRKRPRRCSLYIASTLLMSVDGNGDLCEIHNIETETNHSLDVNEELSAHFSDVLSC